MKFIAYAALAIIPLLLWAPARAAEAWPDPVQIEHFIDDMQVRHGLDATALRAMFDAIRPNPAVLQAIAPPTDPKVRSWPRYRSRFLTMHRIQEGTAFWNRHAVTLKRAEAEFGVPASIIVAIIGVETEYGRNTGRFEVFEALSTLAFAYPRRSDYFRGELEQFLLLARENGMAARNFKGSYAGAIGIPQFMPGSQRKFAVDFDRDGKIDLLKSPSDAIGSVAHFLQQHGWVEKGPVVSPVTPQAVVRDEWVAAGLKPSLDEQVLLTAGLAKGHLPGHLPAAVIDLVDPDGPTEYWWGYANFYAITRYNRSSFYAMSVAQLASSIEDRRRSAMTKRPKADYRGPRRRDE